MPLQKTEDFDNRYFKCGFCNNIIAKPDDYFNKRKSYIICKCPHCGESSLLNYAEKVQIPRPAPEISERETEVGEPRGKSKNKFTLKNNGGLVVMIVISALGGLVGLFALGFVGYLIYLDATPSPLQKASELGDLPEVQKLIQEGASINKINGNIGNTPLAAALGNDHLDVAEFLIANGAIISSDHFQIAINHGDLEMAQYMIEHGGKPSSCGLFDYIQTSPGDDNWDPQIIDFLLVSGVDINCEGYQVESPNRLTALGHAVHYRDFKLVKYLVEKGADVNATMGGRQTPLMLAENGWRQTWKGNAGTTYYSDIEPSPEIANYLREHGAK
jgi:hypothetical protein